MGWVKEGTHDKVYVAFEDNDDLFTAWGRRDAKLQFKKFDSKYDWRKVIDKKSEKYKPIDKMLMFTFFPDFEEVVENYLLMAVMGGKVRQ
jgi:hypothetical protein